jgi:Spy/CpxP family protein refolding chaperone
MKLKNLTLIAGVIALTLTAAPFAVKAQSDSGNGGQPSTGSSYHHRGHGHHDLLQHLQHALADARDPSGNTLALTSDQVTQIQEAETTAKSQITALLNGQKFKDLTADQKSQLKSQIKPIKKTEWSSIQAVLTDAQKTYLKQHHKEHNHKNNQTNGTGN